MQNRVYGVLSSGITSDQYWLLLHDSSILRIKFLQMKDPIKYGCLRILVEGGGCSGFQYNFDLIPLDEIDQDEGIIFERDGIKIVSDEMTLEMINGSTIEYKDEMIRSSFEVTDNPLADSGCSCGVSFTPKEQ